MMSCRTGGNAKSSSQEIIYAHSIRTEDRENSLPVEAQTVPGLFLFFCFVSRMISAAPAEAALPPARQLIISTVIY